MTVQSPIDIRLEPDDVAELHGRIYAARGTIQNRAEEETESHEFDPGNCWVAADEFVDAFPHLRLQEGMRLVCVFTAYPDERQSKLLVVKRPDPEPLPDIPARLHDLEFRVFFREDRKPRRLPKWIAWDARDHIEGDGSVVSHFERSIFYRWINELLNFGHGVYWPRYTVLSQETDSLRDAIQRAEEMRPPSQNGRRLPEDWRPRVTYHPSTDDDPDNLPEDERNRKYLARRDYHLVEFFSYTEYIRETIYRHRDWFTDSGLVCNELDTIAECGAGYIV